MNLRFFATLIVTNYLFKINKNDISNYISCKIKITLHILQLNTKLVITQNIYQRLICYSLKQKSLDNNKN